MNKKASIAVVLTVVGIFAATFSLAATTTTTPSYAQNVGAATTTNATRLNATAGTTANATAAPTLGKQILQETGHIIVSRVTSVTDTLVTIEHTYKNTGTFDGTTSITDIGTATNTINNRGQIGDGKGQGLLRTSDGTSMAAFKEKYTGSQDIHGNGNIQGTMNFTSLATGKLASLHGTNLIFKAQTNPSGDITLKAWELK